MKKILVIREIEAEEGETKCTDYTIDCDADIPNTLIDQMEEDTNTTLFKKDQHDLPKHIKQTINIHQPSFIHGRVKHVSEETGRIATILLYRPSSDGSISEEELKKRDNMWKKLHIGNVKIIQEK